MFGLAKRRFCHKVARKAVATIQPILDAANFPVHTGYTAAFDGSTNRPVLTHRFNNKIDVHEIKFGTQHWEPGESTSDAVNQIASVLVIQFPNQPLTDVFTNAGFTLGPARKCKDQLAHDDSEDASVFITSELSIDAFFRLSDEIDQIVVESGLGDVSGTGGGFGTWCIDLTAKTIAPCLDLVTTELRSRNLEFHVSSYG